MRTLIILVLAWVSAHSAVAQNVNQAACYNGRWLWSFYTSSELAMLERAYEADKAQMAPSDPRLAMSMIKLSYALFSTRETARAEPLFLAGLAQLAQHGTPADAEMAQALAHMAELAICRQAQDQAEKLYLRAIAINEKLPLPKRNQLASSLRSLAALLYQQGRFDEGEAVYARSETVRLELGGKPNTREQLWADAQLVALTRKGDIAAAQAQAQAVVQKAEADQQARRSKLAAVNAELAKANEAKPAEGAAITEANYAARGLIANLQQFVRDEQANLNKSQVQLSLALNAQAELLHSQKLYAQAEPIYAQALALMQEVGWTKSVSVGRVLSDLGLLYRAQGDYEKAQSYQTRALEVFLPLLGAAHPDVQECEQELAFLRKQLATGRVAKK
jgi:hypothetical protein